MALNPVVESDNALNDLAGVNMSTLIATFKWNNTKNDTHILLHFLTQADVNRLATERHSSANSLTITGEMIDAAGTS